MAEPDAPPVEVTIAGRVFRLGAVYTVRSGGRGRPFKPHRLLAYTEDSLLPGGRVMVAPAPSGRRRVMSGAVWAAWAGEPVEDAGRR